MIRKSTWDSAFDTASPLSNARGRRRGERHQADLMALLIATGGGDRLAFARLYEATAPNLFAVALRVLQRESHAEEVLQDAFTSIWRNAARYDACVAAPFTWMVAIVRNRALDVLRHARFETSAPWSNDDENDFFETIASDAPGPQERCACAADANRVKQALATLGRQQREALVLAYFDDKTHAEVAAAMKIPLGTAKSWIRRGLMDLRVQMADTAQA